MSSSAIASSFNPSEITVVREKNHWKGVFVAMNSPCEVLIRGGVARQAHALISSARDEAKRIEEKYSRYRQGSVIWELNHSEVDSVAVDEETSRLFDYADYCFKASEGLFDITTGSLGELWVFDGDRSLPTPQQVEQALESVGWSKVGWNPPLITLPSGVSIDLGGFGKEYAVDRVTALLTQQSDLPLLVNFGGDLAAPYREGEAPWVIDIENPLNSPSTATPPQALLAGGGLATSGDSRRFIDKNGRRYSHILDPRSGWPVADPPVWSPSLQTVVPRPVFIQPSLFSTGGRPRHSWGSTG